MVRFIFGVNQFNKDNIYGEGLRNFNKYCYGQNINIKKIKDGLKKSIKLIVKYMTKLNL